MTDYVCAKCDGNSWQIYTEVDDQSPAGRLAVRPCPACNADGKMLPTMVIDRRSDEGNL